MSSLISTVMHMPELFKRVQAYAKPVYEEIFTPIVKNLYYDEMYDDGDYISPTMFVDELEEGLKRGDECVRVTHGYFHHYGGEGSSWENAFDALVEANQKSTNKWFTMRCIAEDEPFQWNEESGKEWMRINFENYCDHMEEVRSIDSCVSLSDIYQEPDYWGNLTVEITVKNDKERSDALCWLREFQTVGTRFADE